MPSDADFAQFAEDARQRVEGVLGQLLPPSDCLPARLHQAMRYSTLGGGKRLRPLLVYATGHVLEAAPALLDRPACAVELIHAYSLVHDDLPAMDDDDLRRGQPTCHKQYDEATAILAGDALQALAFQVLADDWELDAALRLRMVAALALAAGSRGMVGGQAIDLAAVGHTLSLPALESMHIHKTGMLIRASVQLGALAAGVAAGEVHERLLHYADNIGLAFQVQDDILDEEGETAVMGKQNGADRARNKPSYVSLLGLAEAKALARRLCDDALAALADFDGRADHLRALAHLIVERRQ
ncbi:MAG: (2E,6E)-farnesyl diphosphate synthase [Pseudomonadota bacterium]|uniref:(2E,6E)-farnesyl diphosphate synthase n=1 Tax=Thermithiobacillus tepidarius TaxID=929 RepID=UPI0004183480|nr:farnesyl diphosphate synthase [Thermithiobacillus tepidarius]